MDQAANQTRASQPLWFNGICDDLYLKVIIWDKTYWSGEVHSTRQFLTKEGQLIDKPTKCACDVPLRLQELDHLTRIIEALRPSTPLLEEVKALKKVWHKGKPVQGHKYNKTPLWNHYVLPPGIHRLVTLIFYPEHVKELVDILTEAKTGQKAVVMDAVIAEKKATGKDLFEE